MPLSIAPLRRSAWIGHGGADADPFADLFGGMVDGRPTTSSIARPPSHPHHARSRAESIVQIWGFGGTTVLKGLQVSQTVDRLALCSQLADRSTLSQSVRRWRRRSVARRMSGVASLSHPLPDGSELYKRVIPSDNSCLFTAVGYVTSRDRSAASAQALRRIVADAVAADSDTYNEAVLGKPVQEYVKVGADLRIEICVRVIQRLLFFCVLTLRQWICNADSWGGAIELSILSAHFAMEIRAFDVQTKRCDRYGLDRAYREVAFLLYDGIHYDAVGLGWPGAPEDFDVTVFESGSGSLAQAEAAATQLVRKVWPI